MATAEDSPLKLAPKKKQKLSIDRTKCIICQDSRSIEKLSIATSAGIQTLVTASKRRSDEVTLRITELGVDLDNPQDVAIHYHRNCRASYTSARNLAFASVADHAAASPSSTSQPSRTNRTPFNQKCCIICGRMSHKNNSTLHKIQTLEKERMLKEAAQQKDDEAMLMKIRCGDLIAMEVLYHAACMYHYAKSATSETPRTVPNAFPCSSTAHDQAFASLVEDLHSDLLIDMKVLQMSDVLARFERNLPPHEKKYSTQKIQTRLLDHYGDAVSVIPRRGQGQSNYILSSEVTIAGALSAAHKMKRSVKSCELELDFTTLGMDADDITTLHRAAAILRTEMEATTIPKDYPAPSQLGQEQSAKLMPPLLSKFVAWLVDKHAFNSVEDKNCLSESSDRKSLAIAECIMSCCRKVTTPLQLGLAAQLYHEHGSRTIVETLSAYGFCVSYDELRRFLTSIAVAEEEHINEGVYVPTSIIPVSSGGSFIHEGDDNVDINTETIDGKNTFHSMARVVFQDQHTSKEHTAISDGAIKRSTEKTLKLSAKTEATMQVQQFNKPPVRPEPPTYKNALEKLKQCQSLEPAKTETPWIFLRALACGILNLPEGIEMSNTDQVVPFWTGLQHMLSKKSPSYTIAAYVPVIDAKPSDISTIYTTMKRCQLMTRELQQDYVMQTMDQQLYCIAQQVKWSAPEEFVDHFVRLGGFHTLSTFIAAIGKLWGDAGLRDLLADSGVYAPCTVDQILSGKQFNRAVRGLTLVYEALSALWLEAFITWCNSGDHVSHVPLSFWELLVKTQGAIEVRENDVHLLMEELEVAIKEHFLTVMERFDDESCRMSPTFQFWNGFRRAVQIMLQNIQSERNGDWDMMLHSQSKMLPYMFATNRTNYSRWLPVYLLDMLHLPTALQQTLKGGCFTVRQSPGKFNGVWSDMGVEKTIIKDCKGKGGIVGLTQQKSALLRWSLTRHVLATYAASMHLRSGLDRNDGDKPHDECRPAAMKRDEDQVKSLREHVQQTMTNPFNLNDHPEKLMNISIGLIATTEVQKSLLGAVANGQQKLERVVEITLDTNRSSSLYAPIARSGLKTFTDMTKKTRIKMDRGTLHVNISAESVFRRALTLSSTREDITTKKLLSLPIGPVPTALFHDDGTMRKCTKAD